VQGLETEVSPVNANCLQPKELDMSSSRLQAHSEISRLDVIRLLAFSVLLILPTSSMAQQGPPIAEQIAKTYGRQSHPQMGMEPQGRHGLLRRQAICAYFHWNTSEQLMLGLTARRSCAQTESRSTS
jgi:hypothetical protein